MLRLALAIAVLLVSTSAGAESKCKPGKGTPILEARWLSGKAKVVTKLYATGAWTRVATTPGHEPRTKEGCIASPTFDEIKAALKAAKWKKSKAQAQCLAVSTDSTDFYTNGVKRWTRKTCGTWVIDDATADVIGRIEHHVFEGFTFPIVPELGGE